MRNRLLKSLRIAITAVSLLTCGLLLVFWVRSYWKLDLITRTTSQHMKTTFGSQYGVVYFAHFNAYVSYKGTGNSYEPHDWEYRTRDSYAQQDKFAWRRGRPDSLGIVTPHWFPAAIFATIAAVPWIKWRFSLRTLLIVMTLFAVFFGAIAMSL